MSDFMLSGQAAITTSFLCCSGITSAAEDSFQPFLIQQDISTCRPHCDGHCTSPPTWAGTLTHALGACSPLPENTLNTYTPVESACRQHAFQGPDDPHFLIPQPRVRHSMLPHNQRASARSIDVPGIVTLHNIDMF